MINRKTLWTSGVAAAGLAVVGLWLSRGTADAFTQPTGGDPEVRIPEEALARLEEHRRAYQWLEEGRLDEAREMARRMLDSPTHVREPVEGLRLLAQIARKERDVTAADTYLQIALALVDQNDSLLAQDQSARATIVMDRADLSAFAAHEPHLAIELYDEVILHSTQALPREMWIASQNAAMLCYNVGRIQEAVQRVDSLLASPFVSEIPADDLLDLRMSQASWMVGLGELVSARRKYQSIWNDYPSRDNPTILQAGVYLAGWTPQPAECERRLAWCRELLDQVASVRRNRTGQGRTASFDDLGDLERQIQVLIADSVECADLDFINRARASQGLPAVVR